MHFKIVRDECVFCKHSPSLWRWSLFFLVPPSLFRAALAAALRVLEIGWGPGLLGSGSSHSLKSCRCIWSLEKLFLLTQRGVVQRQGRGAVTVLCWRAIYCPSKAQARLGDMPPWVVDFSANSAESRLLSAWCTVHTKSAPRNRDPD